METQDQELEELLMRWEEGLLTVHEEEALAERLTNDPAARRALVFALMLSGEASRRGAVRLAPSRPAVARWHPTTWITGVGIAAAAAVLMALCLGWPGGDRESPARFGQAGEKEAHDPRGDGKSEPIADEAQIADLIKQLGDDDVANRDKADQALRALGVAASAQLEKAASDPDVERRTRVRAILGVQYVDEVLKKLDAGMLAAADIQGQVEYAQVSKLLLKGTFCQIEGGKKFMVETVLSGSKEQKFTMTRTCRSDGTLVWAIQVYKSTGQAVPPSIFKTSRAHLEQVGLGWAGAASFQLSPVLLVKMARGAARFSVLKEGQLDGKPVAIVEGEIPDNKRIYLSFGGAQGGGGMMQNGMKAAAAPLASKVRLTLSQDGSLAQQLEVLAQDGSVLWSVKLSNVKLGQKSEAADFVFKAPEGARVTDYDQLNKGNGGDPNRPGN